jgi:SAM-dependent methyltransferase
MKDGKPQPQPPTYNIIGQTYARSRRADPRIVDELLRLLDLPRGSIVADIGAGTGNYTRALAERGYRMVAVEPSPVMRAQAAPHPRVTWLDAYAERLPMADGAVRGVVSTLAIHHFADRAQSFREMSRVAGAGPIVLFTFDLAVVQASSLWMRDYWPTLYLDTHNGFPPLAEVAEIAEEATGRTAEIVPFSLPHDMTDLFMASGWRRPELYLDPDVRAGISWFAMGDPDRVTEGVERLRADLGSGAWEERYGAVRSQETLDGGYRFLRLLPRPG